MVDVRGADHDAAGWRVAAPIDEAVEATRRHGPLLTGLQLAEFVADSLRQGRIEAGAVVVAVSNQIRDGWELV